MHLRLALLVLLLGTTAALAFDTSKVGQWGLLFLDDLAPLIAKTPRLQHEVDQALAAANKKQQDVRMGMRFPGAWKNLGGLRVSPYSCDFGAKWLRIDATVRITGRSARFLRQSRPGR